MKRMKRTKWTKQTKRTTNNWLSIIWISHAKTTRHCEIQVLSLYCTPFLLLTPHHVCTHQTPGNKEVGALGSVETWCSTVQQDVAQDLSHDHYCCCFGVALNIFASECSCSKPRI